MDKKVKIFPLKIEWSIIENLRSIMNKYGFMKVSPFIRWILINFYNNNKDAK
jgi:hypothetical protein